MKPEHKKEEDQFDFEADYEELKKEYTLPDFITVIDTKCSQWLNDPEMDRFLRPETLFGTKFESYLQEKPQNTGDWR